MRAGQTRKKWSTGLPPCALYWAGIGVCKKQVQGGWSTGREGMEVGRRKKWSTGLTALCSLLGRQECLPYLRQECLPYLRPVALWLSLPECGFFLNAGGRGMEHRTTALCSLLGRQECLPYLMPVATWLSLPECGFFLNAGGRNGAQDYRPVLSTGQAGMPTLPEARMPSNACR